MVQVMTPLVDRIILLSGSAYCICHVIKYSISVISGDAKAHAFKDEVYFGGVPFVSSVALWLASLSAAVVQQWYSSGTGTRGTVVHVVS